jgi:hypothetical protein
MPGNLRLLVVLVLSASACGQGDRKAKAKPAAPVADAAPTAKIVAATDLPEWCAAVMPLADVGRLTSKPAWKYRPPTRAIEADTVDCQYYLGEPPRSLEILVSADCRTPHPMPEGAKKALAGMPGLREIPDLGDAALAYSDAASKRFHLMVFTTRPSCALTFVTTGIENDITGALARETLARLAPDRVP